MALVYHASGHAPAIPAWLSDWAPRSVNASLCHRECEDGHLVGVCQEVVFKPALRWFDLDEGWKVGHVPGSKTGHDALVRDILWCNIRPVADLRDRIWSAPVILTEGGQRAFRTAYGPDWLPALTEDQARAERIAEAARAELLLGEGSSLEMRVACQWAAELLCITYHLHPKVLAVLNILDDRLVAEVLSVASGLPLEVAHGG